ncbi:MAG TPA: hypothetical protein VNU96_05465 [Burkholderiales bacterium]|jgi:hypothetical protein|nr:hypothetical protein [Burkholderiales bacterium]
MATYPDSNDRKREHQAGAPEQCNFLICTRAGKCAQPSNCLAGVIPVNPEYRPIYGGGGHKREE